jgi:hypothetical protein
MTAISSMIEGLAAIAGNLPSVETFWVRKRIQEK